MQLVNSCTSCICSEFSWKNLSLSYEQLHEFYQSRWQTQKRSWIYLFYRWMCVLFFGAVFSACLILQFAHGKVFIFLTNWGICLGLTTQLFAAILVTQWHFFNNSTNKISLFMLKIYWLLHGVTLMLALIITTVYWAFLHGRMNKPVQYPVLSFVTHCLNSVFMLLDFLVVAFPMRLLHAIYAMLLPIFYCAFTVIYFWCGGQDDHGNNYVYPILNWRNPERGLITFIGVFALYVVYALLLFGIYKIKCTIHQIWQNIWASQLDGLI